jgi:hypothetical protein
MNEKHRWLFSVHGIGTRGRRQNDARGSSRQNRVRNAGSRSEAEWQEGAAHVLNPHFRYLAIHYPGFESLFFALLKLGAPLAVLLLAILAVFIILVRHVSIGAIGWSGFVAAGFAAFGLAHWYSAWERNKALKNIYIQITKLVPSGPPPDIVAHSFGSYLTCLALEKYTELEYNIVILHGCVVARRFPWLHMNSRFHRAINEVAARDDVSYAAALLSPFVPHMGFAGKFGFAPCPGHVHTVAAGEPHPSCFRNRPCSCKAVVHNFHHLFATHGTFHEGANHALTYWLPFLWGYDPKLLQDFRDTCHDCYLTQTDVKEHEEHIDRLRRSCWGWTAGRLDLLLDEELRRELLERGFTITESAELIADLRTVALSLLWRNVHLAAEQASKMSDGDSDVVDALIQQLHPLIALRNAVSAAVGGVVKGRGQKA